MGNLTSKSATTLTPEMIYPISDRRYLKQSEVADVFRTQLENYVKKTELDSRLSTKLEASAASEFATKADIQGINAKFDGFGTTYATLANLEDAKQEILTQAYARTQLEDDVLQFARSLGAAQP